MGYQKMGKNQTMEFSNFSAFKNHLVGFYLFLEYHALEKSNSIILYFL